MTNEQILQKAIEKAGTHWLPKHKEPQDEYVEFLLSDNKYYSIIFSHDFAKAFWGEGEMRFVKDMGQGKFRAWEYHLQQMVLEPDPIKYLERFL